MPQFLVKLINGYAVGNSSCFVLFLCLSSLSLREKDILYAIIVAKLYCVSEMLKIIKE